MGIKVNLDDLSSMPSNRGYINPPIKSVPTLSQTQQQEYDAKIVFKEILKKNALNSAKAVRALSNDSTISINELAAKYGIDPQTSLPIQKDRTKDGDLSKEDVAGHVSAVLRPFNSKMNDPAITSQTARELALILTEELRERLSANENDSTEVLAVEESKRDDFECIDAKNVKDDAPRFAWYPYIPEGELTVLHGGESVGKNVLTCKLMAYATQGRLHELGNTDFHKPVNCWFVSLEDKASAVFKRVRGMGGDISRMFFSSLKENGDLPTLREVRLFKKFVVKHDIKFLAIDNFGDYSSEKTDANSHKSVAQELGRITKMAQDLEMVLIIFFHDNKMNDISGSRAIRTKAGSVLGLTRNEERANHTVLTYEKDRHDGAVSLSFSATKMIEDPTGWREAITLDERKAGSWFAHYRGEFKPLMEKATVDDQILEFIKQNGPTTKKFLIDVVKDFAKVGQARAYVLVDEVIFRAGLITKVEGKNKIISLPIVKHEII